eukprot:scaffold977_cov103-Isochrysis_galbana.AAC.1
MAEGVEQVDVRAGDGRDRASAVREANLPHALGGEAGDQPQVVEQHTVQPEFVREPDHHQVAAWARAVAVVPDADRTVSPARGKHGLGRAALQPLDRPAVRPDQPGAAEAEGRRPRAVHAHRHDVGRLRPARSLAASLGFTARRRPDADPAPGRARWRAGKGARLNIRPIGLMLEQSEEAISPADQHTTGAGAHAERLRRRP